MTGSPPVLPDERGRFGSFGGRYVPEILIPALDELEGAWRALRDDGAFRSELGRLLRDEPMLRGDLSEALRRAQDFRAACR